MAAKKKPRNWATSGPREELEAQAWKWRPRPPVWSQHREPEILTSKAGREKIELMKPFLGINADREAIRLGARFNKMSNAKVVAHALGLARIDKECDKAGLLEAFLGREEALPGLVRKFHGVDNFLETMSALMATGKIRSIKRSMAEAILIMEKMDAARIPKPPTLRIYDVRTKPLSGRYEA